MVRIGDAQASFFSVGRHVLFALILLFAAVPAGAQEQDEKDVLQQIEQAFAEGDAVRLLRHAGDRIEVSVLGATTLYSKAQATYVLQEFFKGYRPVRFTTGEPSTAAESMFIAGKYWYGAEGDRMDVYLRLKKRGSAYQVRELRIEQPVQ